MTFVAGCDIFRGNVMTLIVSLAVAFVDGNIVTFVVGCAICRRNVLTFGVGCDI